MNRNVIVLLLAASGAKQVHAQRPDSIPPTRPIGARLGVVVDSIRSSPLGMTRALSDGRVFVVDRNRKTVRLYEGTTGRFSNIVVAPDRFESAVAVTAYRGDSTILLTFAPPIAATLLDPGGRAVRELGWPSPILAQSFLADRGAVAPSGTVVAQVQPGLRVTDRGTYAYPVRSANATRTMDSVLVLRSALGATRADTVGYVAHPLGENGTARRTWTDSAGLVYAMQTLRPIWPTDEAVMFADGTVAMIRSDDYHIDWIDADGRARSTRPIPHESLRLTDADKAAIVADWEAMASDRPGATYQYANNGGQMYRLIAAAVPPPHELPNEREPFITRLGMYAYRPIANNVTGHVWIPRPPKPGSGARPGIIFDVVDRQGRLVERVQMPPGAPGAAPIGFGPGVVYAVMPVERPASCPRPKSGTGAPATLECMDIYYRVVAYSLR